MGLPDGASVTFAGKRTDAGAFVSYRLGCMLSGVTYLRLARQMKDAKELHELHLHDAVAWFSLLKRTSQFASAADAMLDSLQVRLVCAMEAPPTAPIKSLASVFALADGIREYYACDAIADSEERDKCLSKGVCDGWRGLQRGGGGWWGVGGGGGGVGSGGGLGVLVCWTLHLWCLTIVVAIVYCSP